MRPVTLCLDCRCLLRRKWLARGKAFTIRIQERCSHVTRLASATYYTMLEERQFVLAVWLRTMRAECTGRSLLPARCSIAFWGRTRDRVSTPCRSLPARAAHEGSQP